MSLRTFMRLPVMLRPVPLILKDVWPLARGGRFDLVRARPPRNQRSSERVRLREFASEPEDIALPVLSEVMRAPLIGEYVEEFKAGDFDAVRAILADDVKLVVVTAQAGKVGECAC